MTNGINMNKITLTMNQKTHDELISLLNVINTQAVDDFNALNNRNDIFSRHHVVSNILSELTGERKQNKDERQLMSLLFLNNNGINPVIATKLFTFTNNENEQQLANELSAKYNFSSFEVYVTIQDTFGNFLKRLEITTI